MDAVFVLPPNWAHNVKVSDIWQTGILKTPNGHEQRSALFTWARIKISYTAAAFTFRENAWLTRALFKSMHGLWGVAIWTDGTMLTSQAASGQKILAVEETDYRRFTEDKGCIIFNPEDTLTFETGTIDVLASSQITLTDNLTSTWTAGSVLFPLIEARLSAQQDIRCMTSRLTDLELEFTEALPDDTV